MDPERAVCGRDVAVTEAAVGPHHRKVIARLGTLLRCSASVLGGGVIPVDAPPRISRPPGRDASPRPCHAGRRSHQAFEAPALWSSGHGAEPETGKRRDHGHRRHQRSNDLFCCGEELHRGRRAGPRDARATRPAPPAALAPAHGPTHGLGSAVRLPGQYRCTQQPRLPSPSGTRSCRAIWLGRRSARVAP